MSRNDGMTDLERLIELQAIYEIKARTYAALHTDD
jgi:hypothetical protein